MWRGAGGGRRDAGLRHREGEAIWVLELLGHPEAGGAGSGVQGQLLGVGPDGPAGEEKE